MIVTFGETMLRLTPPRFQRFMQATGFDAYYGGAESNTAVSLSLLGEPSRHVTKLPENELGRACAGELAKYGVDTGCILWDTDPAARLGVYFCERGASQRPPRVIYDRAGSAFAKAAVGEFHWQTLLQGARGFHFTGITPALSPALAQSVLDACKTAKALGVQVSCDLNYRAKLWSKEAARETLGQYMEYVDLLFANNGSLYDVFGIDVENSRTDNGPDSTAAAAQAAAAKFGIRQIALTMRQSVSASENGWAALYYEVGRVYTSKSYRMQMVDRIGGGDSFAAGMLYAQGQNYAPQHALEFATAAACLKHAIPGDANLISKEEVEQLAGSAGNALIQR